MKKKNYLLVCTPIKNIENLYAKLSDHFDIIYRPQLTSKTTINFKKINFIFTNPNMSKIKFDQRTLLNFTNLKAICTASTGTNHIDLKYLKKNKIKLISLRNKKNIIKKITSTAEHAFALLISSIRNVGSASQSIKRKQWEYLPFIGRQMDHMTIGVIGYGRLGKIFVNLLSGFHSKILIHEKKFKILDENKNKQSSLNNILKNSDAIVMHIHADQENIKFIDRNKLKKMKKDVVIVNTSRGEIIDEKDLVDFLKKNKNSKYAADVVFDEIKNKWKSQIMKEFIRGNENILLTPHIAGMTKEAQMYAYHAVSSDLIKFLKKIK